MAITRKEQTRLKLMDVALRLFSENGYNQTTTVQIASEAGVNELTLFRHFGTKEKLFHETTAHYVEDLNIKSEIEHLISQDFEASMLQIARDYLDFCYRNEMLYKIQMRLPDDMKDFVRLKLSRGFKKELESYFMCLLDNGQIEGQPKMMAVNFINCMLGAFTVYVLTNNTFTSLSLEEMIDEQARMFASFYRKS